MSLCRSTPSRSGSEPVQLLVHVLTWPMNTGKHGGYNFWSGIGSGSPILVGLGAWAKHKNCHEKGCWRIGHPHPGHGFPTCRKHYRRPLVKG